MIITNLVATNNYNYLICSYIGMYVSMLVSVCVCVFVCACACVCVCCCVYFYIYNHYAFKYLPIIHKLQNLT